MSFEQYPSMMIPVFVTLGSMGLLYPYFVEGFIIFSFVIMVVLFLLGRLFERLRLKGYYDLFLASLSVIFAFTYFRRLDFIFVLTGVLMMGFALYSIFVGTLEVKSAL